MQLSTEDGCRTIVCSTFIRRLKKLPILALPVCRAEARDELNALGGNGLAVSRTSAHPQEALKLIRYLLQRDAQFMRANEHSQAPKGRELIEMPEILRPYPQLAESGQHGGRVVARPSIVSGDKYEEVSRAYIRTLHSVLAREQNASVAVAALEKELVELTGFHKGPPSKGN